MLYWSRASSTCTSSHAAPRGRQSAPCVRQERVCGKSLAHVVVAFERALSQESFWRCHVNAAQKVVDQQAHRYEVVILVMTAAWCLPQPPVLAACVVRGCCGARAWPSGPAALSVRCHTRRGEGRVNPCLFRARRPTPCGRWRAHEADGWATRPAQMWTRASRTWAHRGTIYFVPGRTLAGRQGVPSSDPRASSMIRCGWNMIRKRSTASRLVTGPRPLEEACHNIR